MVCASKPGVELELWDVAEADSVPSFPTSQSNCAFAVDVTNIGYFLDGVFPKLHSHLADGRFGHGLGNHG